MGLSEALKDLRFRLGAARHAKSLHDTINKQDQLIKHMRQELDKLADEFEEAHRPGGNVLAENLVWIVGSPRTGSTWLGLMLAESEDKLMWREPFFGVSIANMRNLANRAYVENERYMFGDPHKEIWIPAFRAILLKTAKKLFPDFPEDGYLVLKEPNGSIAAPLTMEAFPESRIVFLVRDPRDVIASLLDAAREDSWYGYKEYEASFVEATRDDPGEAFVERLAKNFVESIEGAQAAYDNHPGPRTMLRYEDLKGDTFATVRKLYDDLALPYAQESLKQHTEKHAWENLREDQKGEGKFHRKAESGGWKEDLTPKQIEIVEEITAPMITRYYG